MSPEEICQLASFALGQMAQRGFSVEAAVRWVLRIATLKQHDGWRVWSLMQLTAVNSDQEETMIVQGRLLLGLFPTPEDDDRAKAMFERILRSVAESRRSTEGRVYSSSIGQIEANGWDIASVGLQQRSEAMQISYQASLRILNRVANKAQVYLMSIECGTVAADAGVDSYN